MRRRYRPMRFSASENEVRKVAYNLDVTKEVGTAVVVKTMSKLYRRNNAAGIYIDDHARFLHWLRSAEVWIDKAFLTKSSSWQDSCLVAAGAALKNAISYAGESLTDDDGDRYEAAIKIVEKFI